MNTPTNQRTDKSIENLIFMLTPILEECDLIGPTIPMAQLTKLCRNRQSRLPLRSFNGTQMAYELNYLAQGGGVAIGSVEVMLSSEFDCSTRRRRIFVTFNHIADQAWMEPVAPTLAAEEKGAVTTG
ncbi:MAG: hypothetical protein WCH99_09935 [Verrucomicrobiota bacterium]